MGRKLVHRTTAIGNKTDEVVVVKKPQKRKAQDDVMEMDSAEGSKPMFPPMKKEKLMVDVRKIAVPAHRYTPLKENWLKIYTPIVEHLHLQIRFNLKTRNVEIRSCEETQDIGSLQKAADFVKAFIYGFDVEDGLALVRLDDLFIQSFEITDVKPLKGDHLSRAIGRLAGKNGRTKFTIENVTKTRIVLADSKIHILGSFQSIQIAKRAVCNLILGSPPSKVYGTMRALANRLTERC
uniref:K Homology domain-containing protein n=1 Tax=Strigamia maritima TaxID=126957 RepID=T1J5Z4_STRMM